MGPVRPAPSRPTWVAVPILVRFRRAFALTTLSGGLATSSYLVMHRLEDKVAPTVMAGVFTLAVLTLAAAYVSAAELLAALESGPGDGMSEYGRGQDVEIVWHGKHRWQGTARLRDADEAAVDIVASRRAREAPRVTLRVDGRVRDLHSGPDASAPQWYALRDDGGQETARAEATPGRARGGFPAPHAPVDWEIRPATGPALRVRHDHYTPPRRVTLLDPAGVAWSVADGARAELPDDLDAIDALFVVVLIDRLARAANTRNRARVNR